MSKKQIIDNPDWITINGKHIALYDGFDVDECIEISEHYRRIQSAVDTYPRKYKPGINYEVIDRWYYRFNISTNDRKIKLIYRRRYNDKYGRRRKNIRYSK